MGDTNTLLLLAKYPELGCVKTRLAKDIGERQALQLYKAFFQDSMERFQSDAYQFALHLSPREAIATCLKTYPIIETIVPQVNGNLGEKMRSAMENAFENGAMKVVLIGSDTPHLPPEWIQNAFDRLDRDDLVLGPTTDGGYYLIGISSPRLLPVVFESISWSTSLVLDQTVQRIQKESASYFLLPFFRDIDTVDELKWCYEHAAEYGYSQSQTVAELGVLFFRGSKRF